MYECAWCVRVMCDMSDARDVCDVFVMCAVCVCLICVCVSCVIGDV